jgi:ribosomal protein S18 acetylase RimI-like enzyme
MEAHVRIEPYNQSHLEAIVQLSLRAWAPVFASIRNAMDEDVYLAMHPDWRVTQQAAVEAACRDPGMHVRVAREGEQVAGFVALRRHAEDGIGEIYMIAVDPDFQRRGIAAELTRYALDWFKEQGLTVAMVETGGDPGHAPARAAYEAAGFRALPSVRYFRKV